MTLSLKIQPTEIKVAVVITKEQLESLKLHKNPKGQKIFARFILAPNFENPLTKTSITVEGKENLAKEGGAIYVMNHTDRYNYWPFQYWLFKNHYGHTATWVKGKYYENKAMAWLLDQCNNIPVPSKGYLLTKAFIKAAGRKPTDKEYLALSKKDKFNTRFLSRFLKTNPDFFECLESDFADLMSKVYQLSAWSLKNNLSLLIFPQGTRSLRLTAGHTGAVQLAMATKAPLIPVGCNGSDLCYPGNSPFSQGGSITYRIGKPLLWTDELAPYYREINPFVTQTPETTKALNSVTELMMNRINELLDEKYQRSNLNQPDTSKVGRFI